MTKDSGRAMGPVRRRALLGAFASASFLSAIRPADAVIIRDSTWRAEGGRPGREKAGFKAHVALANQPQFDSLVALSDDDGEEWNSASSTWVGNYGGVGYLLTAAHVYKRGEKPGDYLYRTQRGAIHHGTGLAVHPLYMPTPNGLRQGYDVALVRLDRPVVDVGPPPLLYADEVEEDDRIVIVGFGARGLGSEGEQDVYDTPENNKTAAENTIDEVIDPEVPPPRNDDAGNWMRVTLLEDSNGGSRLDGILGGGDSGGSVWLFRHGTWFIVGVNSTGTGDKYGDHSYFPRISGVRSWLVGQLPGLRFAV
jgi:hypothetical protein